MNIDLNSLVEEEPVKPEPTDPMNPSAGLTLDLPTNEDEVEGVDEGIFDEVVETTDMADQDVSFDADAIAQANQRYFEQIVENFDEKQLADFMAIRDNFVTYVDDVVAKAEDMFTHIKRIGQDDEVIDVKDERYVALSQTVYPLIPLLEHAGKLDKSFRESIAVQNDRLYSAQFMMTSLVTLEEGAAEQVVENLDRQLVDVIYHIASFGFENLLRTLQNYRSDNILTQEAYELYRNQLDTLYHTHRAYLEFNGVPTQGYDTTYEIVKQIVERFEQYINYPEITE